MAPRPANAGNSLPVGSSRVWISFQVIFDYRAMAVIFVISVDDCHLRWPQHVQVKDESKFIGVWFWVSIFNARAVAKLLAKTGFKPIK